MRIELEIDQKYLVKNVLKNISSILSNIIIILFQRNLSKNIYFNNKIRLLENFIEDLKNK